MNDGLSTLLIQLQNPSGEWLDVGYLHNLDEHNWFEFISSYWAVASRPILGQIFEESGRAWTATTNVALPRWFSHLLPEGRLRRAVADAAHVSAKREFQLLRRLGQTDLPGATRAVDPSQTPDSRVPSSTIEEREQDDADPLLKFSLAGAQLKFSIYHDERGLTVPASGRAGNVVLKFPDGRKGFEAVPQVELASLALARTVGISTPHAELVDPKEVRGLEKWAAQATGSALAVQRFDRKEGDTRVHMEELAQVLNIPTAREGAKYRAANFETIAVFVGALTGVEAVAEVIDRVVLNVLLGNGDAHVKNWAFLYPDGRRPVLGPTYDILPTVLYIKNDDLGLNLAGSKRFEAVTLRSFDSLGERSGYGAGNARIRAREATERTLDHWSVMEEYMPRDAYERLTERLGELSLPKNS